MSDSQRTATAAPAASQAPTPVRPVATTNSTPSPTPRAPATAVTPAKPAVPAKAVPATNVAAPAKAAAPAAPPKPPRSAAEIEADIERTRLRIANNIDALTAQVAPKAIANRAVAKAKSKVVDDSGSPRMKNIAIAAASVLTVVALIIWRRS